MRTTIKSDTDNRCTLRYRDEHTGETITRDFFTVVEGGYVLEDWQRAREVCEELSDRGATLIWRPTTKTPTLAVVIRREYRAMRRAERREQAEWSR